MAHPVSSFLAYVQFYLGAQYDEAGRAIADTSWSARLQGSENLWMALEGTHVLAIMLFVGSIVFVDLRLLGLVWRRVRVSSVADSVLPWTVGGFAIMVATGGLLFFANPLEYYHSFIFRLKAVLLVAAAINIFLFHYRIQADRVRWDSSARPPLPVRFSAGFSLTVWLLVVAAGRFTAYDWLDCDSATGFVSAFAQCEAFVQTLASAEAELGI